MKKITILVLFIIFLINNKIQAQSDYYVPVNGGSTSQNGRAPQGVAKYDRAVWIVTPTEMATAGFVNGDVINSLGFILTGAQDIATTGTFVVYMENTTDVTNTKSTTWATAITGMTTVSSASLTIPATTGTFDHSFSGGSSFTYTGSGLYIAFDYQNTGTLATTANTAACNNSLAGGINSVWNATTLPTTTVASAFRPNTRLGKSVTCARPDLLGASTNYTTTTAEVTWTNVTGGGTVELEYGPYNFAQGTGTVITGVTSPYTITGLTDSTAYSFYIRTNCGSGNYSIWNGPFPFHTTFLPANPTYNTGFEYSSLDLIGWLAMPASNRGEWFTYYSGIGNAYNQEGAYSCFSLSNTITVSNGRMYSRGINLVANNPVTITYYDRNYVNNGSTNTASYVLSVGNAQTVVSQTTIATITGLSSTTYALKTYTFIPPADGVYYFSFLNNSPRNSTGIHGVIIDNFTVSQIPNKYWNGSVSTDWNDASNWTPVGLPIATDYIVIPSTSSTFNNSCIISGSGYNALAGALTVQNGGNLTINSGNSITVTDWVKVGSTGNFTINNNSSLVQINNVANTGNIIYKRDASVKLLDYVYWSSPVAGFNVSNIPVSSSFSAIYKWDTTVENVPWTSYGYGNWIYASGENMIPAKGYIARTPNTSAFNSITASTLNGVFTGVPNNGDIQYTVLRGPYTGTPYWGANTGQGQIDNLTDNCNLVGNPYPSAISGGKFLYKNASVLVGALSIWRHLNYPDMISSPYYATYAYNYTPSDYLHYNLTGTSCCPFTGPDISIAAGQSFFVEMLDGDTAPNSAVINFDNTLRNTDNSSFYRNNNVTNFDINTLERNRIWLDLIDSNNNTYRTLVGYVEGATMDNDNLFDAPTALNGSSQIYSEINNNKFEIQGRQLPFDDTDEVSIGIYAPTDGNYTIAIGAVDGLFANQNIYLKDNLTNTIFNIKANPYQFSSIAGDIRNRFSIVYRNPTLANQNNNLTSITVDAFIHNQKLTVKANDNIKKIEIYDINGKLINVYKPTTLKTTFENDFHFANGVYIGKVTLENDMVFTEKLMN